ncbi:MAG TPA: hypothetical protein EYP69_04455, partial [Bacteroidales bacterium]|nr:hypothetical protein [Bacteroidales bacterium]
GGALYDGNEFFTIIPRPISVRDVMEDTTTNRIYYGGDVNFGYLEKNENGRYKIKDLSRSLPDSLNDFVVVLGIEKIKDKIYFFALKHIFIYQNDSLIKTIPAHNSFRYFFNTDGRIFTYDMGYGLVEVLYDTISLLSGTEKFAAGRINGITELNDSLLIFTATKPLGIYSFNINTSEIKKVKTEIDDFFVENNIKNIKHFSNGKIVVGTMGGLVVLNDDMSLDFIFNTYNGAPDDEIYNFIYDKQGNIWFTTNNGFSTLFTQNGINYVYLKKIGIKYLPTSSRVQDSTCYVATLNGLYKLKLEMPQKHNRFLGIVQEKDSKVISGQILDVFKSFDNKIFVSAMGDVILLKKNKLKVLAENIMGQTFEKSFISPDIIYLPHTLGIIIFKNIDGKWKIVSNDIKLSVQPRHIFEYNKRNIFVGTLNGKLYHIRFSDDNYRNFTIKEIDMTPYNNRSIPSLFKYNDTLFSFIYSGKDTNKVYFLDVENDTLKFWHYHVKFLNNSNVSELPGFNTNYVLKNDSINILRSNYIISEVFIKNDTIYVDSYKFRTLHSSGIVSISYDNTHNIYWCATPEFVFNFRDGIKVFGQKSFNTLINDVIISNIDSSIAFFSEHSRTTLSYKHNSLIFQYSASFFQKDKDLLFSYKLEGFDKKWSNLTPSRSITYTNLSPGNYTFKVKAKNIYNNYSKPATFSFTILPPWYMTWWAYIIYVVLLVLLIYISVILYSVKLKSDNEKLEIIIKNRTKELRKKNDLITDSIKYAKKIQDAIIPTENNLKNIFPQSFVIFKPRDIVSGDFFWLHKISDDKTIAAVADCTGHGVPGAFMSMIGNILLNEIVKEHKIYLSEKILMKMHDGVVNSLRTNKELGLSFDGMDIVISMIDLSKKEILLASASQYTFIFTDGTLNTFFGDMYSIGSPLIRDKNPKFETHTIRYEKDFAIFFSSDGYFDQFGGLENKKFTVSAFITKLKEIYNKDAEIQKTILIETLKNWQGNNNQIDDIIVLGINNRE